MRCLACDKRLNDRESVRKYSSSGTFVDLCDRCFATVSDDIPDVEEGSGGSSDYTDEDEKDGGWDYQPTKGDDYNDR